ncbi:MAG TPA: Gfo/Idh/MocA family oxidoreductase [Tepidisphaeraceae bacterium]|nr:Gfo/Idh/MocA family oxidoreductase [Tepidisphaeraceae bacterium]
MQSTHPTRRDLLKHAALAATTLAFPTIVPSSVFGQNAPSNRVNLAAIGVGGRGTDNCRGSFLPLPDARIIAAVDIRRSRREVFAKLANDTYKADICKPYADFREVLDRPDIDAVVISTPDHWHVPLAYYAAQAKKDLYVEKPLTVALAWSFKLREIVNKNKIIFQYGTQQRGDQPQFRRACELVRNGYIGDVKTVDVWSPDMSSQFDAPSVKPYGSTETIPVPDDLNYDMWIGPSPMKPYTADRCTCFGAYHIYDYALGFIAGWAVHPLDIAQWGLGMDHTSPVRYEGTGKIPPKGSLWDTIESWDVNCTYANGVVVRNMGHRVAEPVVRKYHPVWRDHGTTFHGSKGWISVDRNGLYASDKNLQALKLKDSDQRLYSTPAHGRNFIDCIRSRKPTISPLDTAIHCDTISHMNDLCIRLGRPIQWDPEKEQIIGDTEASKFLNRPLRAPWKLA